MVHIETQPMSLKPVPQSFQLSEGQRHFLEQFQQGRTIAQAVSHLLEQGRLPSFQELFDLVKRLHEAKLIQNPMFTAYFQKIEQHANPASSGIGGLVSGLFKKERPEDYLMKHPFFRSQNPVVTSLFAQHSEIIEAKTGTVLCQTGHLERDLFFMIDGEAAIYKTIPGQGRRLLGFFGKEAVIGEVGFFLGELRTADVVCTKPCKLVVIRYDEPAFGRIINKDIAKNLQIRFRVIHALAKSPFLKTIPEEALHALLFAGRVRQAAEFEKLTQENEHGESCFIVISGSVAVSKGAKTIGVLGPGEAFGEIALFFTQGKRTATAMAQRDTTLLEIPARDFYRILGENILLACEFEKLALERAGKMKATAA